MFKTVFILSTVVSCVYGNNNSENLQTPPPCDLCVEEDLEKEVANIARNCLRELCATHEQCRREMRPVPYQHMYLPKFTLESQSLLIKILKPNSPFENLFFRCYMVLDNTVLQHFPDSDDSEYFSNGWYSGSSAFFNSLKKSADDVYSFSRSKLQEVIEESNRKINIHRISSTEISYTGLYSPDEEKCFCVQNKLTCLNCLIKYDKNNIQIAMKNMELRQRELPIYIDCINRKKDEARIFYERIYDNCIQNHDNAWSYYERGLLYFEQGYFEKSLDDVLELLNAYEDEDLMDELPPKICYTKGITESELGLYHDAIQSLSYVIEKDPDHKEAHFERAVAYFEEGAFDLALQDYLASGIKPVWDATTFYDYGTGFVEGIQQGIKEELGETLPIAVPMMSVGMWALTKAPSPHAKIISASMACVAAAALYMTADQMVTELRYIVANWDKLPPQQQGTLCGYLIGKYGIDIFAVAGSAKMMEAYHNLKRANNMLTFELMLTPEHEITVLQARYKGVEKYGRDKKYIQQVYGTKTYPEHEIRNTLKKMGYEIPKKPVSIPEHFETRYADKIGIRYYDPANPKYEEIRLMPGTQYSPNPAQQRPYIVHMRNGKTLNAKGEIVSPKKPEAHIPVEDFIYLPATNS